MALLWILTGFTALCASQTHETTANHWLLCLRSQKLDQTHPHTPLDCLVCNMRVSRAIIAVLPVVAAAGMAISPDPVAVAVRAVSKAMQDPVGPDTYMWRWSYGPGIMLSAMWDWSEAVPSAANFTGFVDTVLDYYINASGTVGYNLVHGIKMPFDSAPGDVIGLFPIAYLDRALINNEGLGSQDGKIATTAAAEYVVPFPTKYNGFVVRKVGWQSEPSTDLTAWGDDQFMGLTLLARLARAGVADASSYVDNVVTQALGYAAAMTDDGQTYPSPLGTGDGLFFHGIDVTSGKPSCCKWGRANGWGMMSHAEVMTAIDAVSPNHPNRTDVLRVYRAHAAAMARFQTAEGMWRQLVNESAAWLETSVTSMTVFSLATGVRRGWLDKETFLPVVQRAWPALAATVQADGTVTGICTGTGIGANTPAYYYARPTDYASSQPGLGSVWRAAHAVHLLSQALGA